MQLSILWASLSGTFLQTSPELVTLLMGHFDLHTAVHRSCQCPVKSLHTDKTVETAECQSFLHVSMSENIFCPDLKKKLFKFVLHKQCRWLEKK